MRRLIFLLTIMIFMIANSIGVVADKQNRQGTLSDSTIKAVVENRLIKEGLRQDKVEVNVDDRVVTLKGKVRSYGEKRRAERVTRSVDDVIRVENKLEVEQPDHRPPAGRVDRAAQLRAYSPPL